MQRHPTLAVTCQTSKLARKLRLPVTSYELIFIQSLLTAVFVAVDSLLIVLTVMAARLASPFAFLSMISNQPEIRTAPGSSTRGFQYACAIYTSYLSTTNFTYAIKTVGMVAGEWTMTVLTSTHNFCCKAV